MRKLFMCLFSLKDLFYNHQGSYEACINSSSNKCSINLQRSINKSVQNAMYILFPCYPIKFGKFRYFNIFEVTYLTSCISRL